MVRIDKGKILNLIEPHFHKILKQDFYNLESVNANELLTYSRFDIAFKLLYLEMLAYGVKFSEQAYKEHISVLSLGKFIEPGNKKKNSIDKFLEDFRRTFEDIKLNNFNGGRTLIPLSKDGSIANGSHRVASAIFLEKEIDCIYLEVDNHIYDYKFFYKRGMQTKSLDIAACKFVEYANNVYVAIIWPAAIGKDKELDSIFKRIVYKKNIELNPNGAHNFISQVYFEEDWIGTSKDNFSGAKNKLVECFKVFSPVRVIAFQAESLKEVFRIKEKIREMFGVGKHSVHITDNKQEAIRISRIVFNNNSIDFLNKAKPNKYISTIDKLTLFKEFMHRNPIENNKILITSSMVMSVYGLRKANDVDYLISSDREVQYTESGINSHDSELKYYHENKDELIFNPNFYFYFNDIKFLSMPLVYKMKKNRGEVKDINDCRMMREIIKGGILDIYIGSMSSYFLFYISILRKDLISLMKYVGIFPIIRRLYLKFKEW
jgi:hypothetical protein